MASVIYYRFRSALLGDKVEFDGESISVKELKRLIAEKKGLSNASDTDLSIVDSASNEEYTDEASLIPKDACVLVKKVNVKAQLHALLEWGIAAGVCAVEEPAIDSPPEETDTESIEDTNAKLRATMEIHHEAWLKTIQQRKKAAKLSQPGSRRKGVAGTGCATAPEVPPGYVCDRCQQPGHLKADCPTWDDPAFNKLKFAIGVPVSSCRVLAANEGGTSKEGVLLLPDGRIVEPIPMEQDFKQAVSKMKVSVNPDGSVPAQLQCAISKDLLVRACTLPCCQSNVSYFTAHSYISESHTCPVCMQPDVGPELLKPNHQIRHFVHSYLTAAMEQGVQVCTPSMFALRPSSASAIEGEDTPGTESQLSAAELLDKLDAYNHAFEAGDLDGKMGNKRKRSDYLEEVTNITGVVSNTGTGSFFLESSPGVSDVLVSAVVIQKAADSKIWPFYEDYPVWRGDEITVLCRTLKNPQNRTRHHAFQIVGLQTFTATGTVVSSNSVGMVQIKTFNPGVNVAVPFQLWNPLWPQLSIGDSLTARIRCTPNGLGTTWFTAEDILTDLYQCSVKPTYMGSKEIVVQSVREGPLEAPHCISLPGKFFVWAWNQMLHRTAMGSTIEIEYVKSSFGQRNFRATRILPKGNTGCRSPTAQLSGLPYPILSRPRAMLDTCRSIQGTLACKTAPLGVRGTVPFPIAHPYDRKRLENPGQLCATAAQSRLDASEAKLGLAEEDDGSDVPEEGEVRELSPPRMPREASQLQPSNKVQSEVETPDCIVVSDGDDNTQSSDSFQSELAKADCIVVSDGGDNITDSREDPQDASCSILGDSSFIQDQNHPDVSSMRVLRVSENDGHDHDLPRVKPEQFQHHHTSSKSKRLTIKSLGPRYSKARLSKVSLQRLPELWKGNWIHGHRLFTVSLHLVCAVKQETDTEHEPVVPQLQQVDTFEFVDFVNTGDNPAWHPSAIRECMPSTIFAVQEHDGESEGKKVQTPSPATSRGVEGCCAGRIVETSRDGSVRIAFLLEKGNPVHNLLCPGSTLSLLTWWEKSP